MGDGLCFHVASDTVLILLELVEIYFLANSVD